MKKTIYVTLFVIFGILFQFLIHALVEMWYIGRLVSDFSHWSLGFSWGQWFTIHYVATIVLVLAGAAFGLWGGFFFWQKIYVEKKYGAKRFFLKLFLAV